MIKDILEKVDNLPPLPQTIKEIEIFRNKSNKNADLEVTARGKKASGCDFFISLHSNACCNPSYNTAMACCQIIDSKSKIDDISADIGKKLADKVTTIMIIKIVGTVYRRSGDNGDYYGVLRGSKSVGVPGVLLEHGYHTNVDNTNWLLIDTNLDKLAVAEADIIFSYFGGTVTTAETTSTKLPYLVKIQSDDGFVNVRKTPSFTDSDIVKKINNSNIKYTIVEEKTVDNVKFGKLKSGIGWVALSCCEVV